MTDNKVEVKTVLTLYNRKDNTVREELDAQLSSLKHQKLIEVLCDQDISAGTEWKEQINTYLDKADIILLLISKDFMASKYNYSVAMKRALERHARGEALVIPIIVHHTDWKSSPFGGLKALPTDAKPISQWGDRDEALLDVVEELRKVIMPPSAQEPLSQPTSEKPSPIDPPPLNEGMGTRTNEPNLPPMRNNPPLSFKRRIALVSSVFLLFLMILASIGFYLLLNRPLKKGLVPLVPTATAISSTATPTISPTSSATAMPMPTATSMPIFIPTSPQKAQAQPTPLPVVNMKSFQSFVQNQQIILSDFSSPNWNRGPLRSGTCTIPNQNKTMEVMSLGPAFSCEYHPSSFPTFFALRVQIQVTKGSEAGLTFSIQNVGTAHSYSLYKIDTGKLEWFFNNGVVGVPQSPQLDETAKGMHAGTLANSLGIIVYKQTLYFYINDVLQDTYSYSAIGGTIGMYVEAGCQAIYTQPTVWQLGPNLNIGN